MKKLSSLSVFFPFYNDAGTVSQAVDDAYFYGKKVSNNLEVIAIHGGNSKDNTHQAIKAAKRKHPDLIIIDKRDNWEGYAVIKYGFTKATKDWIFYTDGDLQYHLDELKKLVLKQNQTKADIINGYKIRREDSPLRVFLGNVYKTSSKFFFRLPIRDTDCDFRLIRRAFLQKIKLNTHDSSILPELIKKLQNSGAVFAEVLVNHYKRKYGSSNFTPWELLWEKLKGDLKLWLQLRKNNQTP